MTSCRSEAVSMDGVCPKATQAGIPGGHCDSGFSLMGRPVNLDHNRFRPRRGGMHIPSALRFAPFAALLGFAAAPDMARADEGGVSLYLPGSFGSLAAVPGKPGWAWATIYYHSSVEGGGNVAASRNLHIGRFNPTLNL